MASAYGAMIGRVSRCSGTSGSTSAGQAVGQLALVADRGHVERRRPRVKAVSTTMATSGAGTAVVSRGQEHDDARPAATSG